MAPQSVAIAKRRTTRTRSAVRVLALIGALASPLAFLPGRISNPVSQDVTEHMSRRNIMTAAAAATMSAMQEPARAAKEVPQRLEVLGVFGPKGPKINGVWEIVPDQQVNKRAVYKKGGFYLMFNDCDEFQFSETITGDCTGFGKEKDGKWNVDGKEQKLKLTPLKKAPSDPSGGEKKGGFELPSVFGFDASKGGEEKRAPEKKAEKKADTPIGDVPDRKQALEEAEKALFNSGRDVVGYTRALSNGGGMSALVDAYMTMDTDDEKLVGSLEAKLLGKKVR